MSHQTSVTTPRAPYTYGQRFTHLMQAGNVIIAGIVVLLVIVNLMGALKLGWGEVFLTLFIWPLVWEVMLNLMWAPVAAVLAFFARY